MEMAYNLIETMFKYVLIALISAFTANAVAIQECEGGCTGREMLENASVYYNTTP